MVMIIAVTSIVSCACLGIAGAIILLASKVWEDDDEMEA